MAPLYRDLHSGSGTLKQIHAPQWQNFLDALDERATVIAQPIGLWLPLGAKIAKLGSSDITCKANLPRVPPSHKSQWIRIYMVQSTPKCTYARKQSKHCSGWQTASRMIVCAACAKVRLLHCYAAADASADGDIVGVGG